MKLIITPFLGAKQPSVSKRGRFLGKGEGRFLGKGEGTFPGQGRGDVSWARGVSWARARGRFLGMKLQGFPLKVTGFPFKSYRVSLRKL